MSDTFWRRPDAATFRTVALWTALVSVWFALIFGGTSYITSLHSHRVRIHFDWELAIPLWPWTVLVYESIFLIFAMIPFVARSPTEARALGLTLAAQTLIAGVAFLLLPATTMYDPMPDDLGVWTTPVRIAMALNLGPDGNMAPSLHVVLGATCLLVFADHAGPRVKICLYLWAASLAASTLLLHQHHVVDVVSGGLLTCAGKRLIFDRLL
ncbi:MAG: hypothetical protein HY289_10500 [Planctomycetes bacterium]|nr:hypothetical protein [Planctomycetota bacterium]